MVVQSDVFNRSLIATTVVCVITSKLSHLLRITPPQEIVNGDGEKTAAAQSQLDTHYRLVEPDPASSSRINFSSPMLSTTSLSPVAKSLESSSIF